MLRRAFLCAAFFNFRIKRLERLSHKYRLERDAPTVIGNLARLDCCMGFVIVNFNFNLDCLSDCRCEIWNYQKAERFSVFTIGLPSPNHGNGNDGCDCKPENLSWFHGVLPWICGFVNLNLIRGILSPD